LARYRWLAGFLLAGGTVFHLWYIASGIIDLAPDEAHYWEWSRRLDWSYYSKGPMVAYLIAGSTRLGGNTEFFVRLPAVLLALGTGLAVYALTRELFRSDRAAFLAVLILALIPIYSAGSVLMTIDAPLMFFWAFGALAFWNATESRDGIGWWIVAGSALGLGLLSKYTMALFAPCALLYLWGRSNRRVPLDAKGPYAAGVVALLLFLPVLVWNAQQDWVSLRHVFAQAGLAGEAGDSPASTFFEFLGSQFGVVSPLLFSALAFAGMRGCRPAAPERDDRFLFLGLFSVPVLAFFLLWSIHSKVQANWAAPAYLTAAVAFAGWCEAALDRKRAAAILSLVLAPAVFMVTVLHFPVILDRMGIDLPPRFDITRRLQGWKELGLAVGALMEAPENHGVFLLSDTYQIAGEMAFYVPGQPRAYNVNLGRRMNQYDIWGGLEKLEHRDALFVAAGDVDAPPALTCGALRKLHVVRPVYRGHPAQVFSIFKCGDYRGVVESKRATTY
jgi:undecaprenyl-diphosphatase